LGYIMINFNDILSISLSLKKNGYIPIHIPIPIRI